MSSGRQPFPHLDSNQDKGFQRPVCCHYTMGESWAFGPQVFIYTILSVFTESYAMSRLASCAFHEQTRT